VLFSHWPNKTFLVPDSCRDVNGNSISARLHRGHHWKRLKRLLFQLFSDNLTVVLDFLTLHDKHNISSLSVDIKLICTKTKMINGFKMYRLVLRQKYIWRSLKQAFDNENKFWETFFYYYQMHALYNSCITLLKLRINKLKYWIAMNSMHQSLKFEEMSDFRNYEKII
jgi:hypothetical protein